MEKLSEYAFIITYRPGRDNILADALSRKSEDLATIKAREQEARNIRIFDLGQIVASVRAGEAIIATLSSAIAALEEAEEPSEAILRGFRLIDEILRANRALESLLGKVEKNEIDRLNYRGTLLFVPETD